MDTCSFAAAGTAEGGGVMKDDFEFLRGLANCQDKEQMARYIEEHQPKPMTNADRIRAMSDDELAKVLSAPCLGCVVKNCRLHNYGSGGCEIAFLKWLKQPAEKPEEE